MVENVLLVSIIAPADQKNNNATLDCDILELVMMKFGRCGYLCFYVTNIVRK